MIKQETKFGTEIITNTPAPLHNLLVNFVEKLEDYYLEAFDGKLTLQDIIEKDPEQLEWIGEVFKLNVTNERLGINKGY